MAYLDEGDGTAASAIVFQHGNPTSSSYLRRNVMPVTWADWPDPVREVFQGFRSQPGAIMRGRVREFAC